MSISQNLKPIAQTISNEKYFCFDIQQSRFIAKRLEFSVFRDSLIENLKTKNFKTFQLLKKKDTIIFKLETKIENLTMVSNNNQIQFDALNGVISQQKKKIKRGKLERWFFGGGLLVLTGIIIAQ